MADSAERLFEDLLPNAESVVLGTKAVFGPMVARFLCFGAGGSKAAARGAETKPWAICIGTTKTHDPVNKGRVLNLVQMSCTYGPTVAYASGQEERDAFQQWPEAVALHDVYEFVDHPHVFDDLKLSRHPNVQAHDKVLPLTSETLPLLRAIRGQRLRLANLPPLPHFFDPKKPQHVASMLPHRPSGEEGRAFYKLARDFERSSEMSAAAKATNHSENGGVCICEGCDFRHSEIGLFEAHHKRPLCTGQR